MSDAERGQEQPGAEQAGTAGNPPETPPAPANETEELKKTCADLNDRYLRLAADFDNFRRRSERDRQSTIALANERFAVDLLEVLDNLERAIKNDDSHLREGITNIHRLLDAQLARHGVRPIDSLKKPFNPAEHEAIAHVPSEEPAGTIIDEVSRGYRMNEKVIRYAKVAVSKGNQKQES